MAPSHPPDSHTTGAGAFDAETFQALARRSVELAADEVFWMREDSRICYVNASACRRLGYTEDELMGRSVWDWDPNFTPEVWDGFIADFRTTRYLHFETEHRTKTGETFPVEITAHFLELEPENLIMAFVHDISERKAAEAALREQQRDLEKLVEDRTAQLSRALEEAQAATVAKSNFLANMSHEIRTPLNGVLGMSQLLARTTLNERQRQAVDTILSSGSALLSLIEDVLDLAQIETGRTAWSPTATTPRIILERAAGAVRGLAQSRGLDLQIEAGTGVDDAFEADPRRLLQVLINIAGNAVKFTSSGLVVIAAHRAGDRMRFEVRDTGPGIGEEHRDGIFDRFVQIDASSSRSHEGAGLGLAIAREIVEQAGGEIHVETASEGGARFVIDLPFTSAEPPEAESGLPERAMPREDKRSALVIDDNAVNRAIVGEILELSGWSVRAAASGEQGLAMWRESPADLVLVDRQMPGLNGLEVIGVIRAEEALRPQPRTAILMITAHAMSAARDEALSAGADGFVSKPFDLDKLLATANEVTDGGAGLQTA